MNDKALAESLGSDTSYLVDIFYDEARRISPDEAEALSLTREAVRYFKDYYKKGQDGSKTTGLK